LGRLKVHFVLAGLLALLMVEGITLAQSSTNFDLSWHIFGGGGNVRQAANYQIQDTIGLAAVVPTAASPNHLIQGGFWYLPIANSPSSPPTIIYLPLILGQ
jgi:hypothetical protein